MPTPKKRTTEEEAIRWVAANTDFVKSLAEEISERLVTSLSGKLKETANDAAMELYVWYRKLGMIPEKAIRKFEEMCNLNDDIVRGMMVNAHLESSIETVSINDVVKLDTVRELVDRIETLKHDYEKEKSRNDVLQNRILDMTKGKK